jgi:hypothetical protein
MKILGTKQASINRSKEIRPRDVPTLNPEVQNSTSLNLIFRPPKIELLKSFHLKSLLISIE